MATAEVHHPVPTAVHDGNCFQEEDNHKVAVEDVPATEVEEAPGAEQVKLHPNGDSKEDTKGQEEDSKEDPKDHEDEAVATDADDDRLMQAVAQEVEAKLGIVQDDDPVAADAEAKPPKKQEQPREVTRKKAAAKAVVVPVDDDELHGEAAAPAEVSPEAPEKAGEEGAAGEEARGEVLEEEKAHEE